MIALRLLSGPVSAEQHAVAARPDPSRNRGDLEARVEALEAAVESLRGELAQLRDR